MLASEGGTAGVPLMAATAVDGWRSLASLPRGYPDNFLVKLRCEDRDGPEFYWDVAWLTPKGAVDGPWKYSDSGRALAEIVGWMPGPEV